MRAKHLISACAFAALLSTSAHTQARSPKLPVDQWPSYGQTSANQNFSPLTQITPANVSKLKSAWTYHYGAGSSEMGDMGLDYRWEVTPLIINGVMYVSTPSSPRNPALKPTVTALEPETGKVIWKYEAPRGIHGRGLAYWPGDGKVGPRLFFATDRGYLMAVDMKTGKLAKGFGNDGEVDAYVGVASAAVGETRRDTWTIPNPASVYKNLIITGARPGEAGPPEPRGDIRAWDARTGKLVWSFHTVPWPGEVGNETYVGDEWKDRSGANVWSTMAVDQKNGILFAPVGDINGRAKGPELFSNTLLALDAATGKLRWYRQIVHKDLWDWDLPTPPVLADVKVNGKMVPAVIQTGKQSLVFVFNRLTGKPIHGFEERPTPRSDDPKDEAWPTQPFPIKPGPLARTQMTRDEIPDLVPGQKAYCTAFWDKNQIKSLGLYSRPLLSSGTINFPSATGGPNWGGASLNPKDGTFIVNVQNQGQFRAAGPAVSFFGGPRRPPGPRPAAPAAVADPAGGFVQSGFQFRVDEKTVLPCLPSPWGELVAVDINKGEILWRAPLGSTLSLGEKGENTGSKNLGGNIQTASGLVFIGATNDSRFRAFDAKTGQQLWSTQLSASAHATPVTYMGKDGKQYVVVIGAGGTSVGSMTMSDTLNAFVVE